MPRAPRDPEELAVFHSYEEAQSAVTNEKQKVFMVTLPPLPLATKLFIPEGSNSSSSYNAMRYLGGIVKIANPPEELKQRLEEMLVQLSADERTKWLKQKESELGKVSKKR